MVQEAAVKIRAAGYKGNGSKGRPESKNLQAPGAMQGGARKEGWTKRGESRGILEKASRVARLVF
jgi:hypothetical protein